MFLVKPSILLFLFLLAFIGAVFGQEKPQRDVSKDTAALGEVVVSGTMRATYRSASPVAVEVYTPAFFRKNPSPGIFEALQLVNGVRPQLNCNVCNTGDIHINGMEGPYTLILIDGMPIISSLASVYGLQGIPTALIERVEIVKGPASSLYGSEAMGGLINVITKQPAKAPGLSMEYSATSWREHQADIGWRIGNASKWQTLVGLNYYNFTHRFDKNRDGFTDVTLQHRFAAFLKTNLLRPDNRNASLAFRFITEDRFGGEMNWTRAHRGTDLRYGEQISTSRMEMIGNYRLPTKENLQLAVSANWHLQHSAYGIHIFNASQQIAFAQVTWEKNWRKRHQWLAGIATRYSGYDDNTPVTASANGRKNQPERLLLPGIFAQEEWTVNARHLLLGGLRLDFDSRHGAIFTPRFAWKWQWPDQTQFRFNAGSGFRVVNLFTEDHAALTGARKVVITEQLKPEKSLNWNLNLTHKWVLGKGYVQGEWSAWYTYFFNRIVPDYLTDPNAIIYSNLDGSARSIGTSLNLDAAWSRFRLSAGATVMDVVLKQKDAAGHTRKQRPVLTENWSGTWTVSYSTGHSGWTFDYTGNLYGPMRLPLLSPLDPRKPNSPIWSVQNLQVTKKGKAGLDWFAGVKNLLDFTPVKGNPFLIARSDDPFDKRVVRDNNGRILPTPDNPYALSFDPNYVYAPNQGRKFFVGIRYTLPAATR